MRVAWLISNHGWGHLSRSLVCLEALVGRGHAVAAVVAPEMAPTVASALPTVTVITGRLDRGYVFGAGGRGVDREASRALFAEALAGPEPALIEAVRAWAPDIVAADATPWASTLAEALGTPSVLVSNFSWDDQFDAMYAPSPEVDRLHEVVARTTLGLELPLGTGLPRIAERRRLPLVSRMPRGPVRLDGLGEGEAYVAWAFGRTAPRAQPLDALRAIAAYCRAHGLRLAIDAAVAAHADLGTEVVAVAPDAYWPDVLASARLVLTKAGYSSIAESLRGTGYVLGAGITGLPEERAMLAEVEASGYGLGIPWDVPAFTERMVEASRDLLARAPRTLEVARGELEAVAALEALAG
ncbi:MAG: glycosyltransferase family protein [Dehalococcoidia bacterium]|nr:glycosyltransferase family protein [Dehalococcoidia bacterium]